MIVVDTREVFILDREEMESAIKCYLKDLTPPLPDKYTFRFYGGGGKDYNLAGVEVTVIKSQNVERDGTIISGTVVQ